MSLKNETQKELQAMRFELRKELQEIHTQLTSSQTSLGVEINKFRTEILHNLSSLEQKMIIKLGLMQASSFGIFIALVKFF